VHTDVHLVYDATANKFLPGNHVVLTDRATQCLTSFSLDFERKSANTADGPDMTVNSVTVNGQLHRQAGLPRVVQVLAQEAGRQAIVPLSRAMASRSAAASGRSPNVSDSTGPLNQWPRGHRILVLSSGPSVDLIR
jgi:hypothetical protein